MNLKLEDETPSAKLATIAAEAWEKLCQENSALLSRSGRLVQSLAQGTEAEAEAAAAEAKAMVARLRSIPLDSLIPAERITHGYLGWHFERRAGAAGRWRGSFAVTPYMAMALAEAPNGVLASFNFESSADGERYLSLLSDYARLLIATTERINVQAKRGWRIPRPALPGARAAIVGLKGPLMAAMRPAGERLVALGDDAALLERRIDQILAQDIGPAFDTILAALDADYASKAGDAVGLMHLPRGEAAYRAQIKYHLTFEAEPEALHASGIEAMAQITEAMAQLRGRMSHGEDEAEFHARLRASPSSYAVDPDALEASYRHKLARVTQRLPDYFSARPKAGFAVKRLARELEARMSFGYYQPGPKPGDDGVYYFNGSKLDERMQLTAAPLIFHELTPGAHFQLALQRENETLPAIRRNATDATVFTYGWAGYAAGLASEMGLYDDPFDAYGYLLFQRFAALRLVLDTGMNGLGWSLERAREYMRANTLEVEAFIASETLRYSTDLPGQALNYHIGPARIRDLRHASKARLGEAFDIRRWHAAVLAEGALPLPLLEDHLRCWADSQIPPTATM